MKIFSFLFPAKNDTIPSPKARFTVPQNLTRTPKFCYLHGCELVAKGTEGRKVRYDIETGQPVIDYDTTQICPVSKDYYGCTWISGQIYGIYIDNPEDFQPQCKDDKIDDWDPRKPERRG